MGFAKKLEIQRVSPVEKYIRDLYCYRAAGIEVLYLLECISHGLYVIRNFE